jgi:predicted dehydrogenase
MYIIDMISEHVLLIGHGSIGKFHLNKLVDLAESVDVVEPLLINQVVSSPKKHSCNVNFYTSLSNLPGGRFYSFAVIANWGPDHVSTILELLKYGVNKFLVEKPLCDSLSDLIVMEKLISSNKIELISHYQWSYSYLPELINEISKKHVLGNTISMVVNGGAKCLVTNGIHFLALAEVIFKELPSASSIIYMNDEINPRNKKFVFLEGNATWRYPNSKYLSINFFNKSHVALIFIINFEFGYAIIQNDVIKIYVIPCDRRSQFTSPTRTAIASDLVYEGPAFSYPDGSDGTDFIYSKLLNGPTCEDSAHGIQTTKDFILTLEKNKGSEIDRDLSGFHHERLERKWNLS